MTEKDKKELANKLGETVEYVEELIERGNRARALDNRFEAKPGDGVFIKKNNIKK